MAGGCEIYVAIVPADAGEKGCQNHDWASSEEQKEVGTCWLPKSG